MEAVWRHQKNGLMKVGELTSYCLKESDEKQQKHVREAIKSKVQKDYEKNWEKRKVHFYLKSKVDQDKKIDNTQTNKWMNHPSMTSHVEGFLVAIQEQEITTRATRKTREKDPQKKQDYQLSVHFSIKRKRISMILYARAQSYNVSTHQT